MQHACHDRFVQSGCLDDDIVRAIESAVRLRPFVLLNCLDHDRDLRRCGHHPFSTIVRPAAKPNPLGVWAAFTQPCGTAEDPEDLR
jgi:hypothetical protein